MNYLTGAATDIGIEKRTNQDSVMIKIGEKDNEYIGFAMVCDGMGGLSKGELASAHVITAFSDWFDNTLVQMLSGENRWKLIRESWNQLILQLNDKLFTYGKSKGTNLGTTITGVITIEGHYLIVNVGDSRTYLLNDTISQITEDQSFVAREVKLGRMTWEEAEYDTRRNVLLQCVGATGSVEAEFYEGEVHSGDTFLLCSDGFRHEVTPEEILTVLNPGEFRSEQDIELKITELIELNKSRNENDNITAAIIKLV